MPWLQIRGDVSRGQGRWGKEVRQGERKASVATWKLRNTTLSAWKTSARPPGLPLKPLLWGTGPAQFTGTTSSPDQASGLPQGLQMPPHCIVGHVDRGPGCPTWASTHCRPRRWGPRASTCCRPCRWDTMWRLYAAGHINGGPGRLHAVGHVDVGPGRLHAVGHVEGTLHGVYML